MSGVQDKRWAGKSFGFTPLRGIRYFGLTTEGVLRSQHDGFVWADGVNEARCLHIRLEDLAESINDCLSEEARASWPLGADAPARTAPLGSPAPHDMVTCSCGFHALTAVSKLHNFSGHGNLVGILEGSGEVVEGRLGFRASQGRIVALVAPLAPLWAPKALDRWGMFWGKLPKWKVAVLAALYLLFIFHSSTVFLTIDWVTSWVTAFVVGWVGMGKIRKALDDSAPQPFTEATGRQKLLERYPGVHMYDTIGAMLRDFPVTTPEPDAPALSEPGPSRGLAQWHPTNRKP